MAATSISIGSRTIGDDEILSMARKAEDLDYDTIWVGESWGRDAFTVLTMIACHTSRIRLGTGITTVYSRTPTLMAQSIASLDMVSKGRATLGLGTSGPKVIEEWHGLEYGRPLQRTREYIDVVRMALSGEPVNYQGRYFQLGQFRLLISSVQERIPIYVASIGPRNMHLTGELADGWLPIWVHVESLPGMKHQVDEGAAKAGRSIKDVIVAPQVLCSVARTEDERAEGQRRMRAHMAFYIGGMGPHHYGLFTRYGYVEEARLVREAWANNEREKAAALISDEMLDNITICGDAEECREKLEKYRVNGADVPVITFPNHCPRDVVLHTLEVLAPRH